MASNGGTDINVIYGVVILNEHGNALEGGFDKEPDVEDMIRDGVMLITYGLHQASILGISESLLCCFKCDALSLGQSLEAKPGWSETLIRFCKERGIRSTEPRWFASAEDE